MLIPQRYEFSSKSQPNVGRSVAFLVVADTTKVRIFKQITTLSGCQKNSMELLLIPQRYEFSSKSQPSTFSPPAIFTLLLIPQRYEFSSKSQQDEHYDNEISVVADTTKVRIFKQITTEDNSFLESPRLLLIPQRYEFSSKSQHSGLNFHGV